MTEWVNVTEAPTFRAVYLQSIEFYFRAQSHMLLLTSDEESALLLESVFLPGQQQAVNEVRKR